ncbi:hypothetical protein QM565_29820 [Geitlerinema splendidum]|nr:hypothetical protein [Geitlerinema splendidum]
MLNLIHLLASPAPYLTGSRAQLIMWIMLPPIIAFVLLKILRKMHVAPAKWIALIPCVIGIIVGIQGIMLVNDPLAQPYLGFGERSKLIMYVIAASSLISGALILVMSRAKGDDMNSRL